MPGEEDGDEVRDVLERPRLLQGAPREPVPDEDRVGGVTRRAAEAVETLCGSGVPRVYGNEAMLRQRHDARRQRVAGGGACRGSEVLPSGLSGDRAVCGGSLSCGGGTVGGGALGGGGGGLGGGSRAETSQTPQGVLRHDGFWKRRKQVNKNVQPFDVHVPV